MRDIHDGEIRDAAIAPPEPIVVAEGNGPGAGSAASELAIQWSESETGADG